MLGSQAHTTGEKWSQDPNGKSVIDTEVIANFMMKRSQQKAIVPNTSFDFYSNKKYLRMQSNSSLVSALTKQQKRVLISNDPIAEFNFHSVFILLDTISHLFPRLLFQACVVLSWTSYALALMDSC